MSPVLVAPTTGLRLKNAKLLDLIIPNGGNMQTGTLEAGIPARKFNDMAQLPYSHGTAIRTDIILAASGATPDARRGPQAFLVEQSANSLAGSHYHIEAQFQVVVAGGGSIGRHTLTPYTVHYANAYTGYGPLQAGPEGLSYVTLRAHGDPHRPFYLPDTKDQMKPGPRLNLTSEAVSPGNLAGVRSPTVESVIAPRPDGIAAWRMRVPANLGVDAPRHDGGGGQFRLVVDGQLRAGSVLLGRLGCGFLADEEVTEPVIAGGHGVELLILQFARERSA